MRWREENGISLLAFLSFAHSLMGATHFLLETENR